MKKNIVITLLTLAVALFAEKGMTVHTTSGTVNYAVADIDSITFNDTTNLVLPEYSLTVTGGVASHNSLFKGQTFAISARVPGGDSLFVQWVGTGVSLLLSGEKYNSSAVGIMGSEDVNFTATYRSIW